MRVSFSTTVLLAGLAAAHPAAQAGTYTNRQTLTGVNGRTCTIEKNTDRPGGDYAAVQASTFEQCVGLCTSSAKCATAQYHTSRRYCYLKSVANRPKADPAVDSVVCKPPTPCNAVTDGSFEDVSNSALFTYGVTSGGWTLAGGAQFASNENFTSCDPESGQTCPPYVPSNDGYKAVFFSGQNYRGLDSVSQTLTVAATGAYTLSYAVIPFDGVPDPAQEDIYHCTLTVRYGGAVVSSMDFYGNTGGPYYATGNLVSKPSSKLVFSYKCPNNNFPIRVSLDSISTTSADSTCA